MGRMQIAASKDHFVKNSRPFFYLADTCWSAFTNASLQDWQVYLDNRREQGFNAVQVNILPQWDASASTLDIWPYTVDANGTWDWEQRQDPYFERAATMAKMAHERGITPALVVLWCNYVQGTWGAERTPKWVMPLDMVQPFTAYAAKLFASSQPIYLVSGDTGFTCDATNQYYLKALETIKAVDPQALTTLHLQPGAVIPDVLVNSPHLDFYMFQSGHGVHEQERAYTLVTQFLESDVKRPIVNGEPCYEGIGHHNAAGRFMASDVRKASWQSLLSGAKAGVTYGCHGIWSWHEQGVGFSGKPAWNDPFPWRAALRLPGAADMAYAQWLFATYGLVDLEPCQRLVAGDKAIQAAMSKDKSRLAAYLPYSTEVTLNETFPAYEWVSIDLATRTVHSLAVTTTDQQTVIPLASLNGDSLVIGSKT